MDLWQQLYGKLLSRRGEQEWVNVPSHLDLEGNERADELASEGVQKHGVRLAAEGNKDELSLTKAILSQKETTKRQQQRGQSNKGACQSSRRRDEEWKKAHDS